MSRRSRLAARPRLELLDDRCLLSAVTPTQINSAYGLNAITFSNGTIKGNGAGQTIAIVDAYHDPSIYSDLTAFDAKYGIPNPTLTSSPASNGPSSTNLPSFSVVGLAGSSGNSSWNMEVALDVEMAHAAAPGANIVLVEARSDSTNDLIAAINAAKGIASVSVISMSWGGSEFYGERMFDGAFTTPAGHAGITFVSSAGDSGAGAEWPASSPNVVGVGGTSLVVASTGSRTGESAWSSSGGGISRVEPKPSYQSSAVAGNFRGAPDVSLVADPNTGVVIVTQGGEVQVGGTSLSAPIFGALIAIADQGLALGGKPSLDGPTQTLPGLYKAPSGSFFDVISGSRATTGYDTSTGLGTPNAPALVGFLSGTTTTAVGGGGTTVGGATAPVIPPTPARPTPPPHRGWGGWGGWWNAANAQHGGSAGWASTIPYLVAKRAPSVLMTPESIDAALQGWGHEHR